MSAEPAPSASLLTAFQGALAPSPLSWPYRVGLGAVAFAMVLLPTVYVALIAFAGWGIYWHVTHNISILHAETGRASFGLILVYVGPIIAGLILIFFMVKPFFARRAVPPLTIPLEREREPLLFEFVERICGLVGAPPPARIEVNCDVNASASFRRGFGSLFGNDLVLTIGLPLVAGLNMRQFAGVLAHEFGHFAQGAAMRLTYIIRRVNAWFARVVYERDQWDLKLEQTAKSIDLRVGVLLHGARGAVWLTRKILWALMHLGHAISCFMLRQMEFDADSYECKLAGSDTFAETTMRIQTLAVASQHAFGDLSESWRSGRLPDNFAAFVQHKAAAFPTELRGKIQEEFEKRKTRAFDTHPADRDRVKAAQAMKAPGVFRLEDAATNLFADFSKLSQAVTREFYVKQHELTLTEQSLISTEESVKESRENELQQQAMDRYYCGINMAVLPFKLAASQHLPLPDWKASLAELERARQKAGELKDAVQAAVKKHEDAEGRWIKYSNACTLRQADFTFEAKDFGVNSSSVPALEAELEVIVTELRGHEQTIQPFYDATNARLAAALQILNHAEGPCESLAALKTESTALLELLGGLSDVLRSLHQIRRQFPAFDLLLQNRPNHQDFSRVDTVLSKLAKALQTHLDLIHDHLKDIPYPFPHASGRITVSQYAHGPGKYRSEIQAAYTESQCALDRLYSFYYKIAGRLATIAASVEERVTAGIK